MELPKIIIKYSRLLDPITTFYTQNNPNAPRGGWDKWVPPAKDELEKRIENYKLAWNEIEAKVLSAMCNILGLEFKRNIIDVHVVSGLSRQLSWPLVIKSGFSRDDFISTLMHELLHIIQSDNDATLPLPGQILDGDYGKEVPTVQRHVIVHAVLKYLYLDILKRPELLEANLTTSKAHSTDDYLKAWNIVEKEGYLNVINQFKKKFKSN